MGMLSLAQDFFRLLKAEFRTVVFNEGVQRAGESRLERSLMICGQDGSEVGLASGGDS